jgi:hypothetical protein
MVQLANDLSIVDVWNGETKPRFINFRLAGGRLEFLEPKFM